MWQSAVLVRDASIDLDASPNNNHHSSNIVGRPQAMLTPIAYSFCDSLLRTLKLPAFAMRTNGQLVAANSLGQSMLVTGLMKVDGAEQLRPCDQVASKCWRQAFDAANLDGSAVTVLSIQNVLRTARFAKCSSMANNVPLRFVVVTMSGSSTLDADVLEAYASYFGLTISEQYTLMKVCTGLPIQRIADERNVKPSTVRSYVKAILGKTSKSSLREVQAELARLSRL